MAGERHGLAPNPVAAARKARQRRRKLEQYLTAEEVEQLVAHAPSGQEAVLYEAAARTGLRWGELRPLRWGVSSATEKCRSIAIEECRSAAVAVGRSEVLSRR